MIGVRENGAVDFPGGNGRPDRRKLPALFQINRRQIPGQEQGGRFRDGIGAAFFKSQEISRVQFSQRNILHQHIRHRAEAAAEAVGRFRAFFRFPLRNPGDRRPVDGQHLAVIPEVVNSAVQNRVMNAFRGFQILHRRVIRSAGRRQKAPELQAEGDFLRELQQQGSGFRQQAHTDRFRLTDRAGSHAFDVNTLANGKTRALCYSPALTAISGNEGAVLTFDVTATGLVAGDITVDGIELVTTDCQPVRLNGFAIGVNTTTGVSGLCGNKTVSRVDYYNLAGQRIDRPKSGVTLVVTTYTDGTRTTAKVIK